MIAALRGSYVQFVIFAGVTERYPPWFEEELYDGGIYTDESRYTFWAPFEERRPDYYDKQLVEDYSVFLRKENGEVHVTDYDVFQDLYLPLKYDMYTNSGVAAFREDTIEYVELHGGVLPQGYPEWFYEFFTEAVNLAPDNETVLFYEYNGELVVSEHSVLLRNKRGEIMHMEYHKFEEIYEPNYSGGLFNED